MRNGDLVVKYKDEQKIDTKLDKKIENFFETHGYELDGCGFSVNDKIRELYFREV